jgi:allophanate hydrolase subunit 1
VIDEAASILPFGEAALLVSLGDQVEVRLARRTRALARAIEALRSDDPRWGPPTPAASSVLVRFDPLAIEESEARDVVARLASAVPPDPAPDADAREVMVPVRYGGDDGPDLEAVARETGLTRDAVIGAHVAAEHEVLFIASLPLPVHRRAADSSWSRASRRRDRCRAAAPDRRGLSGIYPHDLPGGWRIVGRTELDLRRHRRGSRRLRPATASARAAIMPGEAAGPGALECSSRVC